MKKISVAVFLAVFSVLIPTVVMAQMGGKTIPPRVLTDTVVGRNQTIYRKYNGQFEPIEKVTSLARISGLLEKINFQEGDMVEAGQVLFEIEDVRYQAAVRAAQSRIDVIKAKIKYAQNTYERNKVLTEQKAVAVDTAENTLSVLEGFRAELLGAEAELTLAQEDLKYTRIISMLKGRVGRVNYTEGNYITPQSGVLVTVVQIDPIYVRFSMSERDFTSMYGTLDKLQETAELSIQLASGEYYKGTGRIAFIDNQIKSRTDTICVWAEYENPEGILNPGGLATVLLARTELEEKPAVKLSAIMFDREGHFVYTTETKSFEEKDREGKVTGSHTGTAVVRRNVTLGATDGEYQTIESGLNIGEVVVVDGTHKAVPGDEITPIPVEPTPAATEEPAENTAEIPTETPAAPFETPAEAPLETPADAPAENAAEGALVPAN